MNASMKLLVSVKQVAGIKCVLMQGLSQFSLSLTQFDFSAALLTQVQKRSKLLNYFLPASLDIF